MKANEVIINLAKYGCEKEVFVIVFKRDGHGDVISKKKSPISAVFSHGEVCSVFIEESEMVEQR